ncbi:hypothetical protein BT63DRAFT_460756 [Microthyrium microscopicum]|uniref:Uncharacterized protein n=1 Tax=Microthyrium microscopicum TaxID=703497 RepID=A0A6A6TWD0_9PEZI|nr:hypothetical protein BT63DRAFT_460756 [Microthyrium microscopicum]
MCLADYHVQEKKHHGMCFRFSFPLGDFKLANSGVVDWAAIPAICQKGLLQPDSKGKRKVIPDIFLKRHYTVLIKGEVEQFGSRCLLLNDNRHFKKETTTVVLYHKDCTEQHQSMTSSGRNVLPGDVLIKCYGAALNIIQMRKIPLDPKAYRYIFGENGIVNLRALDLPAMTAAQIMEEFNKLIADPGIAYAMSIEEAAAQAEAEKQAREVTAQTMMELSRNLR